ncbi:MAG: hypothetical protein LCI03_06660 [Actinobacteria bacterium]|nr:hypothetical protein [Actinomycetota bacterium]
MRTFSRFIAFVLALALFGTTYLHWVGNVSVHQIAFGTLVSPGTTAPGSWLASLAIGITAAAVLILLASLFGSRMLLVIGGLIAVGLPTAWLLVNILGKGGKVLVSTVGPGAWGAIAIGVVALLIAAVAADPKDPHVR